jgi:hypothetical protein
LGDPWDKPRKVLVGFCLLSGRVMAALVKQANAIPGAARAPSAISNARVSISRVGTLALELGFADLAVAGLEGRPRPRGVIAAFASAVEADRGRRPGGALLTRVSTRSAASRSAN